MSKEIEELKGEIRAALQEFSEEEIFFLTEIGRRVDSPSQAVRRVSPIVHLDDKEEEVVRKVAKLKKMVRGVDQGADFFKVLQDLRKPKESEMSSFKERLNKVREKERKGRQGSIEGIERIIEEMVKYYEDYGPDAGSRSCPIPEDPKVAVLLEEELKNAGFAVKRMPFDVGGPTKPTFYVGLPPYCDETFRPGGGLDQVVEAWDPKTGSYDWDKVEKKRKSKPSRRKKKKDEKTPRMKLATRGGEDSIDEAAKEFINTVVVPDFRKGYEDYLKEHENSDLGYDYWRKYPLDSWELAYRIRIKLEEMNVGLHCDDECLGNGHPHFEIRKYKDEKKALELLNPNSNSETKIEDKAEPSPQNQTTEKDYESMTTEEKTRHHIEDGNVTDFSVVIRSGATSRGEKWEAWGRLISCHRDSTFRHELELIAENKNTPSKMRRAARKMLTRL